jgi:hypothetical protein
VQHNSSDVTSLIPHKLCGIGYVTFSCFPNNETK